MCDKSSDTIKGIHVHGDILIPLLIYMCDNNSDPLTITLILVLLTSDKTSDPNTFIGIYVCSTTFLIPLLFVSIKGISIVGGILIPLLLKEFLYLAVF